MSEIALFTAIRQQLSHGTWINSEGVKLAEIKNLAERLTDIPQLDIEGRFFADTVACGTYSSDSQRRSAAVGTVFSGWIKKNYKINIIEWEPDKELYPRYLFLGTDKGILAYLEFFYHASEEPAGVELICNYGICHELNGLIRRLSLVDSDLDRPVFYVHILDYPDFKGIFFETAQMIKNNIFENRAVILQQENGSCYFSDIRELGQMDELIEIFKDLKRNNVRVY